VRGARNGHTTALFADECQSFLDNVIAGLGQIGSWKDPRIGSQGRPGRSATARIYEFAMDRFTSEVSGVRCHIGNMNRLPCLHDATMGSSRTRSMRSALPELGKSGRHPKHCGRAHSILPETK
jgi:hypothetical protein